MSSELMRQFRGFGPSPQPSREFERQARNVLDEGRLCKLEFDVIGDVAEHLMDRLIQLDSCREALARGDSMRNAMLSEIELTAFRQGRRIQSQLFTP